MLRIQKCIALALLTSIIPALAGAEEVRALVVPGMTDVSRGDFEKDAADAREKMEKALQLIRRNGAFREIYRRIEEGRPKEAEEMLNAQLEKHPEYASNENYRAIRSGLAYANKDYKTAYVEANALIEEIERVLGTKKPYELRFKDKDSRDGAQYAYLLRYQALMSMQRNEEALLDIEHALKLKETPNLLFIKMGLLVHLKRFKEAAVSADKSYALDKKQFLGQGVDLWCWAFHQENIKVKGCSRFTFPLAATGEAENKSK